MSQSYDYSLYISSHGKARSCEHFKAAGSGLNAFAAKVKIMLQNKYSLVEKKYISDFHPHTPHDNAPIIAQNEVLPLG